MKPLLLTLLTAALLSGATGATAQSLRIAYADPVSSLDPQLNNHAGDRSLALHVWESLLDRRDDKNLPGLAESWKAIDANTWEFKIRQGVKWQDGQPFTADDLVFSLERARNVPGSVAPYSSSLRTVESVSAPDPYTLRVKTSVPNPLLVQNIDSVYIVSRHVGAKSGTEDYNSGKAVIGTGPYRLVSYAQGDRTLFERNKEYWGKPPLWDTVDYRFIANPASRTAALLAGDVDVIDKVSPQDVK